MQNFAGILEQGPAAVAPLQLIVDAVDATADYSVFGSRLVRVLVDFKWFGFAREAFFWELALYLVHMTLVRFCSTGGHM